VTQHLLCSRPYGVIIFMGSGFRHAAIIGKFQARGIRPVLEEIAHFLMAQGLEVSFDRETASATGVTDFDTLTPQQMGGRCDIAVVVGGDGTMLGIARELAKQGLPLVGINQGRLGFITDVPMGSYKEALAPMIAGDFEEESRSMLEGDVWRDGEKIFAGLSLNDVVVSRGATASMVELRVDVDGDFVANMRADGLIVATPRAAQRTRCQPAGPSCTPASAAG
jgi:NAD+ kinase